MRTVLLLSSITIALTSCAVAPTKEASPTELRVPFTCVNGEELEVRFFPSRELAVLSRGGKTIELPQQISGSGFIYGNGQDTIRGKGNDLTVETGGMTSLHCKAR